jgi:NAD(P)H-nitrite reductase large subunit
MKAMGQTVKNSLCLHFEYSRPELWTIAKVQNLKTFSEIAQKASKYPNTSGCEVCKPAVASILAGLWNDHILNDSLLPLQDTNDRYLANIQRGGLYSVIPRIAAGEVTPEKLEAIAKVAMEYSLYTKITGAQRIDISKYFTA